MVSPDSIVARAAEVAISDAVPQRRVVLALDRADAQPLALEGTAILIWDDLDGRRRLGEIADALAAEFAADPAVVRQDVVGTAARFVEHGVARLAPQ